MADLIDVRKVIVDISADKRWRTFERGDITVIIAWMAQDKTPCMVLMPGRMVMGSHTAQLCIIPMLMAWAWSEEIGDAAHCAQSAIEFCDYLGFDVTRANVHRVFTVIRDHLDDLLTCPPPPLFRTFAAATTKQTNKDTGQITEGEIHEDV